MRFPVVSVALCVLALGGCLVVQEGDARDSGTVIDDEDAGRRSNALHGDGGGIRPPDPMDASVSVVTDASGVGGSDAGLHPPDAGGGPGMDAGRPDAATGGAPDAAGVTPGCTSWQECAPHYADPNSAYECRNNTCVCDPDNHWQGVCESTGSYFSAFDCFCVMGGSAPPSNDPNPDDNCGWEWDYYCENDTWHDTSHYERYCETVSGETQCRDVWVDSGYWESGGCNHVEWVWKCR